MRLSDIMSRPVAVIGETEPAELAHERMTAERVHHFVVVAGRSIVGILSERDLGGRRGESTRRGRLVGELMSPDVVTAGSHTTLRDAANLLRGHAIGCLPIVDDGRLVGIITVSDLLEVLGRGAQAPEPALATRHACQARPAPPWGVARSPSLIKDPDRRGWRRPPPPARRRAAR
jgi:acetoin utilization protein AcuB